MERDNYLESRVLTAPSHRLHLMLIEGAIRFGRQAEQAMQRGNFAAAAPTLMRVLDIVGELLVGVRQSKTPLNRQIEDFYQFLLRRVTEARVKDEVAALTEVLQLLEYERQTWQLVCDKLGATSPPNAPQSASRIPRPKVPLAPLGIKSPSTLPSGFSLEA